MSEKFDFIVIGAGPNGLAIAAYLTRAGQKVLLLEKRIEEGGGLMTEQVTLPEYYHNTHALYMMMVDQAPIYSDFEFESRWNVRHVFPDLQVTLPTRDGRALCFYRDVEKTCKSIAEFSSRDAEAYRKMHHLYAQMMDQILGPQTYVPMDPAPLMAAKAYASELGRELAELTEKTPLEIVTEMYEHEVVRAAMLYMCTHWGLDYSQSGVSYMVPIYLNRMVNYRLTCGGSHRVSNALYKSVFANGGEIRQSVRVKRIQIENGVASGVLLEDGREFHAEKAVVSTLNPHQTFLDYVGTENLDADFVAMIKGYMWEKSSMNNVHLALDDLPNFKAASVNPDVNQSLTYILGVESVKEVTDYYDAILDNRMPERSVMTCSFPSVHDSYQAPRGKSTAYLSQVVPYDLQPEGKEHWYDRDFKKTRTAEMIDLLAQYTTNINDRTILKSYMTTPVDIENKFATMAKGGFKHGAYHPLQMGYLRPNQDCSQYRTPIKNLYVGGASVAPGGMIIWGPGYNCANALADDYGIEKWWSQPENVRKAIERGYV
ncbi:FAD dependent oxidoreductase [Sterolibacterium denitrificans]|uniref:Pyridine nucleotide-disulfide oxidoreductase domain-containing protein 2 n=1 Tax=Sterolibacterium denitrificans TaxID=157592 RepID=A0A7Z7MVP8_9PROT|nr:NAD(P)/FAD-dependent oxidoreductase [Sterolibacterium denitrificans]SMB26546.1 FAD dependent oxidoreductase [Sterolibacterium denitrificans]